MLKSWLNGCCLGVALLAWGSVQAQEPLPAPRRTTPPRRTERIDRIRKLGGQLVESFSGEGQLAPKPVDVPRLNQALMAHAGTAAGTGAGHRVAAYRL